MTTAILVLDLINDIVSPNGKISALAEPVLTRDIINKVNLALKFSRSQQWLVIQVRVGFSAHYNEQPKTSPIFGKAQQLQALTLGQWGTAFHKDLDVTESDYILTKHRISPFYGTPLDLTLRNNAIKRLLICGVSSAWAVQSAVREGHDLGYELLIIEDGCAAVSDEEHQLSMKQLSRIARIIKTDNLSAIVQT